MAHSKQAWAKLKSAYRRGEGSIAELGPKFGIPAKTAATRCTREKWVLDRVKTEEKAQTKAAERDIESLAGMLTRHRELTSRILRLVAKKLDDAEKESAQPVVDEFGVSIDPLSAGKLNALSLVVARTIPKDRLSAGIEPSKPVKPVELDGTDEVTFEIDAPPDEAA